MDFEVDMADHVLIAGIDDRQVSHDECRLARGGRSLVDGQLDGAAHHHRGEFGVGRCGRGLADHLPETDDGDAVGDLPHLAELVGDEHDGRPTVAQLTHDRHQFVGLLRCQHRRRFVEDQDARIPRQRLDDLDPLLDADREILDQGIGIDVEPESAGDLADLGSGRRKIQSPARLGLLVSEHDVLGDGEHRDQHEVLVHHADAGLHRVAWPGEVLNLIVQQDLAGVGLQKAVEDVHQGRLACAVLAEQAVDLAGLHDEVDVIVGDKRTERLRDATKFEFHLLNLFG